MKTIYFSIFTFIFVHTGFSQVPEDLFKVIQQKDSLLFQVGFNTCTLAPFYDMVSDDCEFYHDQSGFTNTKAAFIEQIEHGLCKLDYKATRELIPETMEVFPMSSNGKLYGAIQQGRHRFYATYSGKDPYVTSEARFSHLWLLQGDAWKLSRVLSFDHRAPEK